MKKAKSSSYGHLKAGAAETRLDLSVEPDLLPRFYRLLSQGFSIHVQTGGSLKDLLCRQLGIQNEYLTERIQTIFLNGKAVDDAESAVVLEGSTVALSAAMPGMVGATLRKSGFFASMRSQVSYQKIQTGNLQAGRVTLKLFNLVARELGPSFLERGIRVGGKELRQFFNLQIEELQSKCSWVELDAKKIDVKKLLEIDWEEKEIFLCVRTGIRTEDWVKGKDRGLSAETRQIKKT
jgi:hypothetical protein